MAFSQSGYGIPSSSGEGSHSMYQGNTAPGNVATGFPSLGTAQQFLSNPVVAGAAMEYGQGLVNMGQSYVDKIISQFAPSLKLYFAVDTSYVLKKLQIILLPYTHRNWSLQYNESQPVEPRQDVNTPDLYIPAMALMTYILLSGFVMGTQQRFTPEGLGMNASSLLAWLAFEIILVWLSMFLFKVTAQFTWLDIVAYCSYKYVSMIVCVGLSLVGGLTFYYVSLAWTATAIAFFQVQSLRLRLHSDMTAGASRMRNYLLLIIALIQPLMVLWLTWSLVSYVPPVQNWKPPPGFV